MSLSLKSLTLLLTLLLVVGGARAATPSTIEVAGRQIAPGEKRKFASLQAQSFEASYLSSPIFVAHGMQPGHRLCITAGIHGDELNGMEIARRVFTLVDVDELAGTLIVFPSVNAEGARAGRRDMIDQRDLNRSFPGNPSGSIASIVANALFTIVASHCDALIDLHTGSNKRFNIAQIRVTANDEAALDIARHFGVGIIALGDGPDGSLRREASKRGIPAIIYEGGVSGEFQEEEIAQGTRGVVSVIRYLDMLPAGEMMMIPESQVFERTRWTRVPSGAGGYFFPTCTLGGPVEKGQVLGYIVDPLTDARTDIAAPHDGQIIGFATPQIVLSGYALFHIGLTTSEVN